jgi:phosphoserine phosphatase
MKLCVFDFDSTLMDGETINFLAEEIGIKKEVAFITKRAMAGEIDFFESLRERVFLLKGMSVKKVDEICHNLPYVNGAKEIISKLKEKNYKVIVFSGGFRNATDFAKEVLSYDASFANMLHSNGGKLSGLVGGDMMFGFSKGDMLKRIQALLKISSKDTIAVGDGANDLSMFKYAKYKVAFCANEVLKKEANILINEKDLNLLDMYL